MNDHQKLTQLIELAADKYLKQAGTSGKLLLDFNIWFEKTLIRSTLSHYDHNLSETAKALGISRTTLYKKIQRHSIKSA
jgi:DNA-binding NtrC family response regulator